MQTVSEHKYKDNTDNHKSEVRSSESFFQDLDKSSLIAVRVCLLAIALCSTTAYVFYYKVGSASTAYYLFKPIAFFFGFCALSALWMSWRKTGPVFTYLQFLADACFITFIVWITGGISSPFAMLFLPLIVGASLISSRNISLALALSCATLLSLLTAALQKNWLAAFANTDAPPITDSLAFMQCITLTIAMLLVAIGTSYLRKMLWSGRQLVEKSQKDLADLNQRQKALIEGISEGIISTNPEGVITHINQAAVSIFKITESAWLGQPLIPLLHHILPDVKLNASGTAARQEAEFTTANGEKSKILFYARAIINEHGESNGSVFIFQDITTLRSIEEQLVIKDHISRLAEEDHSFDGGHLLPNFVGESPIMKKVFRLIERVAPSEATILVTGESGTGKELVAKAIHQASARRDENFVAVNCGAIPENLMESQLFGHKKGSFTGADSDHGGFFLEANGGTILLDEIGELPLHLQTKLLRVLQERCIRPVGGTKDIPIDVRVISATNRNLKNEVEKRSFREDLYYRLNVISISLPPLRDRALDVPLLTHSILKKDNRTAPAVSPAAMQLLMQYDYPGNVRELENILERAKVLGGELILPEHLPEQMRNSRTSVVSGSRPETQLIIDESIEFPINLDTILSSVERRYLEAALLKTNGAKKKAAQLLGINFRSFRYRLQKFDLGE